MDDDDALVSLSEAARALDAGATDDARRAIQRILDGATPAGCRELTTWLVFAAALTHRLEGRAGGDANLYLRDYDVPQIHLFALLAQHVPTVFGAVTVANDLIARALHGRAHPTLLDVGIGTGQQIRRLLVDLEARAALPRELTVLAIEPQKAALQMARDSLLQVATKAGTRLHFTGIEAAAEDLTAEDWDALAERAQGAVINAAFALHHLRPDTDGVDRRTALLADLGRLHPSLIVLLEPSSGHAEPRFLPRFEACLHHFRATFRLIDALPIDDNDRQALKVCFFGREIVDILAAPEDARSERHERTAVWRARMAAAGYAALPGGEIAAAHGFEGISVSAHEGYAGLDFEGETLVAVLAGVCSGDAARPASEVPAATLSSTQAGATEPAPPPDMPIEVTLSPRPAPPLPSLLERAASPSRTMPVQLDAELYLATLMRIARAGEAVDPRARAFIEEQARLLRTPTEGLWALETLSGVIANAGAINDRARRVILRDLVFIARIDDGYSDEKRASMRAAALRLGLTEEDVDAAERSVDDCVPSSLDRTPDWFRERWFVAEKR